MSYKITTSNSENTLKDYKLDINNNLLIIKEDSVSIKTNVNYKAIMLYIRDGFSINSLLPNNYLISKNNKKIMIIPFTNEPELDVDLFNYNGVCNIYKANLYDSNKKAIELHINKDVIVTWDNLKSSVDTNNTITEQVWENLSTWYEKMSFDGRNNYSESLKETISIDASGSSVVKLVPKKEIPLDNGSDNLSNIIGGLYTKGLVYQIEGANESYTGDYHIHLKTKEVMTGKEHTASSKKLVNYTIRKKV